MNADSDRPYIDPLVVRCLTDDPAAWRELYLRTRRDLGGVIRGHLAHHGIRDSHEAEDILQQLWSRLAEGRGPGQRQLRRLTAGPCSFLTSLERLARRLTDMWVRSLLRRRRAEAAASEQRREADPGSVSAVWLTQFLASLPPGLHVCCLRELGQHSEPPAARPLSSAARQQHCRLRRCAAEFLADP
jgi:hypothetical protein